MVPVDGGGVDGLLDNADEDVERGIAVVGAAELTAAAGRLWVGAEQPTINARTANAETANLAVLMSCRRCPRPVGCINAGHAGSSLPTACQPAGGTARD
jgi:hypothetical protein